MRLNDTIYTYYKAIKAGTGYSIGNEIVKVEVVDTLSNEPTLVLQTRWFNQTTYLGINEPIDVDLQLNNSVTVLGSVMVSNMIPAVETGLNKEVTQLLVKAQQTDGTQQTNIYGAITKVSVTATASGDTTIVTPAAGKKIRLFKFSYSADGNNAAGTVASLKFGANPAIDKQWLDPKQPYADGLTMRYYDGAINEAVKINLSVAVSTGIYINLAYQEI